MSRQKLIESNNSQDKKKTTWKNYSKKKKFGIIFLFLFLITSLINISYRISLFYNVNGEAEWIYSSDQKYLKIEAQTNYDLGFLTGFHLSKEILFQKLIIVALSNQFGVNYDDLLRMTGSYVKYIPKSHIEEMRGISRGVSYSLGFPFSFEDVLIQNLFIDLLYGYVFPQGYEPLGCSAIGFKNSSGVIVAGQNVDYNKIFKNTLSFTLHKLPNKPWIFSIRMGASLNWPIGKNENGVLCLATVVRTNIMSNVSMPMTSKIRIAYEESKSGQEFISNYFNSSFVGNPTFSFTYTISDNKKLFVIDAIPNKTYIKETNISVRTNTFTQPELQNTLSDKNYSKTRQEYIESKISNFKLDKEFNYSNLFDVLGDVKVVQRAGGIFDVETLAFLTYEKFGLGAPYQTEGATIPI